MGFLEKYFSEKTIKSFGLTTEQILGIDKKLKEAEEERLEEEREAELRKLYLLETLVIGILDLIDVAKEIKEIYRPNLKDKDLKEE